MPKYFTRLKLTLIKAYGSRKHEGMLSLIYNTRNKGFLVIPKDVEHSIFIAQLLNISLEAIKNRTVDVSYFIPVTVIIAEEKFASIIVGISSLEMGCNVVHKKSDLFNARNATITMLGRGPLKLKEDFKEYVSLKYAIPNS